MFSARPKEAEKEEKVLRDCCDIGFILAAVKAPVSSGGIQFGASTRQQVIRVASSTTTTAQSKTAAAAAADPVFLRVPAVFGSTIEDPKDTVFMNHFPLS